MICVTLVECQLMKVTKKNKYFIQGERCHHCFNVLNEKRKERFKERQKQIKLSKAKNLSHIGPSYDKYKS